MLSRSACRAVSRSRPFTSSAVRAADRTNNKKDAAAEAEGVAKKFQNTGSIGSKFEQGGSVAEIGEKIGGPFASDGMIGKQFSAKKGGAVGGAGQKVAEASEDTAQAKKNRK